MTQTWSIRPLCGILLASSFVCAAAAQDSKIVTWSAAQSALTLADTGHTPGICISAGDAPVVGIAANALAGDLRSVTKLPVGPVQTEACAGSPVILIGTLDHSSLIDSLRRSGKLDTSAIEHQWESYVLTLVRNPMKGVPQALVIAGSDRRGTAYGVFELSREIGVSPWSWWADVPTMQQSAIYLRQTTVVHGPPTVRYRGIFLNDEDWGLRPWAAQGPDRDIGNIGPHTYEHVFELLLRLRANTLYPAMHPGTTAFNAIPENALLADRYAIVMGSSHSEALLRNNVGEYSESKDGPWDFATNASRITQYWQDRLRTNGKFENLYTVGMRGVHDSGMEGQHSLQQQVSLLEHVFDVQRTLLRQYVNPNVEDVPQVFWIYKEVLDVYRAGLHVPDDVTLGWSDDNYGYIREFPTASERTRKGGSGVYYHVSYWGEPHDYLWLCTTPPALIREEMTKAYDLGARRIWILNVGDLKPAEGDIDYFLTLAWDAESTRRLTQQQWLVHWLAEQFPAASAPGIAAVLDRLLPPQFRPQAGVHGLQQERQPDRPSDRLQPPGKNSAPGCVEEPGRRRGGHWQQTSTSICRRVLRTGSLSRASLGLHEPEISPARRGQPRRLQRGLPANSAGHSALQPNRERKVARHDVVRATRTSRLRSDHVPPCPRSSFAARRRKHNRHRRRAVRFSNRPLADARPWRQWPQYRTAA
jgi:hypothetical protein